MEIPLLWCRHIKWLLDLDSTCRYSRVDAALWPPVLPLCNYTELLWCAPWPACDLLSGPAPAIRQRAITGTLNWCTNTDQSSHARTHTHSASLARARIKGEKKKRSVGRRRRKRKSFFCRCCEILVQKAYKGRSCWARREGGGV